MTYQSAYRSTYRRHRYRHRRRNSHYGVLVALILVVIIAVPVAFHVVKGISSAIFGGDRNQLVYQIDNTRAFSDGRTVDLSGAAPYRDTNGNVFVSAQSLCDNLGLELSWEDSSKTAVITARKDTLRAQVDSKTIQFNDESRTISAAPVIKDGTTYVPVRDICQAFSWQVGELDANMGDLVVVSQSKKELDDERLGKIADEALAELGPSEQQLASDSVLMRTGSDKLQYQGDVLQMKEDGSHRGLPVVEQDGVQYVPLDAAMNALGGTATFDGDNEWTVSFNGLESTVRDNGKTKVDGKRVRGDDISAYTDSDSGRFYVSAPLFAALLNKTYTALDDGSFVFAVTSLDGFDSQKAYLSGQTNGLTQAVGGDIPDADVYIALTFDDGPTGAIDGYPNGLTAYLLDGLKERGAHATFFMVGNRVNMFSSTLPRLVSEGHELGNHTMTHPMQHLTGLSKDGIRQEITSATSTIQEKAGQAPTVLRPVGGGVNSDVKAVAKELGLPIINWSVDTQDWKNRNKQSVHDAIMSASDGSVVLMHDLYPTSVEGALSAIDDLQKKTDKTYAFVTVSELAAIKGITLEPGVVYNGLTEKVAQQIEDGTYKPTEFT
ncbi:polysaccharide deacetylase family protein [Agathobaculum sp. Marseille-P7918]|uniref:polysaccharide deacetylase family protein n=1 Tax=Agathobaculum sp. Marseille-P7918 TaxID=2479843 RepID=UPI000F630C02|nr:polysaccharide deacetylase family protein [Agathobaculum sp. Marseille-P7918]